MYNVEKVLTAWGGLIGWRQNHDPNAGQIDTDLLESTSGMYYQDEHPLLTLQNLQSIMPDYALVNYPAWDVATAYAKDSIIKDDGINYQALRATTGSKPVNSAADWKVFEPFSSWLRTKTQAAMQDCIINFLEGKELVKTAKPILENKTLFDGIGRIQDTIAKRQRRAGFEIVTSRSKGITPKIERIGLQFTAIGDITIYLHHSSQEQPLKQLILSYSKINSVQWFALNWELPYVSDLNDSGGAYYITYVENETPGLAIRKDKTWNELPCESCASKTEVNTWKLHSPYIEFHPFTVPQADDPELWDITDNRYEYTSNQGINFALTLYCDYTDLFIEQADLFKSVLRKQVAINLLRELAYNPNSRINQSESTISVDKLLYEIDGDTRGRNTGIKFKYEQALSAIQLNVEGLNRLCLPCKKNGVRYRTV